MTPQRLAEIEQAATRYGAENCWTGTTGTLAGMIRELLRELNKCQECNGTGDVPDWHNLECPSCKGSGTT